MMDRVAFHKLFKAPGPVVLPVIHVLDTTRTEENLRVVIGEGAAGVFLINHDFPVAPFLPIIRQVRERFPNIWLGVNFLAVTGLEAFPVLGELEAEGVPLEAYWADDARIDERLPVDDQAEAEEISAARSTSGWRGLYFGGTAFKKQREVAAEDYEASARLSVPRMDVVTTSGVATGHAADLAKIAAFRDGVGDGPLAVASGITPENAARYGSAVDAFLVATGINREGDFYTIDPGRLAHLMKVTRDLGQGEGGEGGDD
ncbi:MAG: BtpA/SgcQ family protein [Pseudomonadota bacterium]